MCLKERAVMRREKPLAKFSDNFVSAIRTDVVQPLASVLFVTFWYRICNLQTLYQDANFIVLLVNVLTSLFACTPAKQVVDPARLFALYNTLYQMENFLDMRLKLKIGSLLLYIYIRSLVRFPMVSMEFFIDIILPAALWPRG